MQKQLLPPEYIDHIVESYLPKVSVKSQLIYSSVLIFMFASLAALPFIFVDVTIQASGSIRPIAEKTEIRSLVAGRMEKTSVSENQTVKQGQIIYSIAADDLNNKLELSEFDERHNIKKIEDLKALIEIDQASLHNELQVKSGLYTQQLNFFRSQIQENVFAQERIQSELERDQKLFKDRVISKRELESREYEQTKLKAEYASMFQKQKSEWQADLNQLLLLSEQKKTEKNQIVNQKYFYSIKAPVTGTMQLVGGKYEGSYVQAGETLAFISPDSAIIAECLVLPQDIGLLKSGMPVRFQIETFNYNQWGLVNGTVFDISRDYIIVNEQLVFKVKCQLEKTQLSLKNGYQGNLKKGMSVRARFIVTKRSLYQLLYDNIDNWVNPYIKKQ